MDENAQTKLDDLFLQHIAENGGNEMIRELGYRLRALMTSPTVQPTDLT
jgi:hypothetical protein